MQLRRQGYRLSQLGHSFLVHYPHLDSAARQHWNGGKNGAPVRKEDLTAAEQLRDLKRAAVDKTFVAFKQWLEETVPDETMLGKCHDAFNDDERLWVEENLAVADDDKKKTVTRRGL